MGLIGSPRDSKMRLLGIQRIPNLFRHSSGWGIQNGGDVQRFQNRTIPRVGISKLDAAQRRLVIRIRP